MIRKRPSMVQQLQYIEDIFKILKEPFFEDNLVHEDNLVTSESDKKIRVNDLYKKFIELSGDRKVEFYNDFITKCWHYFLLQQQKIDDDPQSNQAKLIKLNINEQLQILGIFKKFLIIKKILPESSNSISPPNSIDSLLISWTTIPKMRRVADNSRNSTYFNSRSKIIKDLDKMKNISNPKDDLFFREYLLKHIELVDLYRKQNIYLKSDYSEKFNKYVIQARKNCLNYLLSITDPNSSQNFNLDLGEILPSEHNKRYLEELKKLKAKLKDLHYEDRSGKESKDLDYENRQRKKLDEFISHEISEVNIQLSKVGIISTRSTYPLDKNGSKEGGIISTKTGNTELMRRVVHLICLLEL